jgi:3-phosphoshikimate 1-carboxyvinyltransferase
MGEKIIMSDASGPKVQYKVSGGCLKGDIRVPGDKSVSHRSIMFGSLAKGVTHVTGFLEGEDSLRTLNAFRHMGVGIEHVDAGELVIEGVGMQGLKAPAAALDLGNSGTAMRLMSGVLAGQAFETTLIGDASLSSRPMSRVVDPLTSMGALIDTADRGRPPLNIKPSNALQGFSYACPMASAQVKSAVLLAGLYAKGTTTVTEPAITRDHTERMLRGFGYHIDVNGLSVSLRGGGELIATDVAVPSDISSAAFFMVGASIAKNSDITLRQVGLNPTRTGVIDILRLMGGNLEVSNQRESGGELIADIRVRSASLKGITIPQELVSLAIDEFPVLFVAAACAKGVTVLSGAEELRVKESDRIQVVVDGLLQLGVKAEAKADGAIIYGGAISGGLVDSCGDHRVAMAFSMAGLVATDSIVIDDCANVATSFPGFTRLACEHGLTIVEQTKV